MIKQIYVTKCFFDNYTTIGPSDQDSNLQKFFDIIISLNSVCYSFWKKKEEIGHSFIFNFFLLLNFNIKKSEIVKLQLKK